MVTRVDPFLGGLGIDATGKFEVASNATVTVGDGTSTGNVVIGGELIASTVSATTYIGLSSNAITSSDTAVVVIDPNATIVTDGIERVRVNSSGNVGIGTTAPAVPLHISSATPSIRLTDTDDNSDAQISAAAGGLLVLDADINNEVAGSAMLFRVDGGSEKMRILSSGNVGIGTTVPTGLLTIGSGVPRIDLLEAGGSAGFDTTTMLREADVLYIQTRNNGSFVSHDYMITTNASGASSHQWRIANSEKMRIDSSGNVGIGTTAPGAKLGVNAGALGTSDGNQLEQARFSSTTGNAINLRIFTERDGAGSDWTTAFTRIQQRIDSTDMGYVQFNGADNQYGLSFGKTNTEYMRIENGGNVGIGTSSPAQALDVSGNIAVSGTVDGRDIATDGTKLDGIESGATADQTASEILTAIKTVDGAGSGLDADLLDGISSASFLRSDAADTATGVLTLNDDLVFANRTTTDGHIQLYGGTGVGGYGFGIEGSTLYYRAGFIHRWYIGTYADAGSSDYMELTTAGLTINGNIVVTGTVDGRDVATDGTKLDGIESGATADQTASEILTAIKTVDGSGSGLDADLLDGISSASFLRSDAADSFSGAITGTGSISISGNINTTAKIQEDGADLIPPGSIIMYGAAAAPGGWYLCEGGAISRSTYAALFSAISTTYGVGNGSTTFNVPDFRDRAPYGASTFVLGTKTAGEVNASGQNSTGTGTTGSGGPTTHTVTTSTTNSTTDKDVSNAITVVTGVSAHAAHTHSVPALTVTHPGVAVKFIIKT